MKKIVIFLLCFLFVFLASCGKDDIRLPENVSYYDTISVIGLAANAKESLSTEITYMDVSGEVLETAGGIRLDLCDQYICQKSDEEKLDEYGIFHVSDADKTEVLYQSVLSYVSGRKNDTVTLSHYEDADTVKNGSVAMYGNYVIYTFFSGNGNAEFQNCVQSLLTQ